jgi:hypothetical protein
VSGSRRRTPSVELRVPLVVLALLVTAVLLVPSTGPAGTPASYPSCGFYWNRNTPVSATQRRVNACIVQAAREGRRARAVTVLTTVEGDPIPMYVFVRGKRNILLVSDSTRDRYGPQEWTRHRCTRLGVSNGHVGASGCVELGTGKPLWLKPVRLPR